MENRSTRKRDSLPSLFRNMISLIGATIAVASLLCILFLFLAELFAGHENPYLGIFTFIIFPAIMIAGLLMIPIGMLIEHRRRRNKAPSEIPAFPRIDLNIPRQRRTAAFVIVSTFVLLLMSTVGSYRAYEYTDSVEFCGQLCHAVMNPEHTAYLNSPHARVTCVECHVGPGATWYVRSKLSGAYQVYAATFNKYPRPIKTPIESLRPSQETCEQCHWPEKFYGAQLKVISHFATDETNTPSEIRMLINTGGGSPSKGPVTGIHWHVNKDNVVTFISTDEKRQVIPWVMVRDKDGNVTEYMTKDSKITRAEIDAAAKRHMECVDCHNRPSHIFNPPTRSVDNALVNNKIDRSLPFIKQQAVEVLSKDYQSTDEALSGIARTLDAFYRESHPDVYSGKKRSVDGAIAQVQQIFRTNMFPEMKVDWRTHPDNIGHFGFQGCYRCHDGQHFSKTGKVISNDCNLCHTILSQTESGKPIEQYKGQVFKHPIELPDMTQVNCTDCHSATGN